MKKIFRWTLAGLILTGALVLVLVAALPLIEKGNAPAAWESYLKNPYSVPAIEKYLLVTGNPSRWVIGGRIISGVYRANHNGKPILYIVEFASNKSDNPRTFFGTLMAFDAGGKHLKTWDRESVEKSVVEPDSASVSSKIRAGEIIDLPDINGDSYSEIPTYRFGVTGNIGGTLIVYRTHGEDLSCIFAVECNSFQSGSKWGEFYLERNSTGKQGLILKMQHYAVHITYNPGTTAAQKVNRKIISPFKKVVKPPSMELVIMKQDSGRPPETLAEFQWSESLQTFTGPESGLSGVWNTLDARDREIISKTMIAPKQPGLLRKLKYLVFSSWKKKLTVVGDVRKNEAGLLFSAAPPVFVGW